MAINHGDGRRLEDVPTIGRVLAVTVTQGGTYRVIPCVVVEQGPLGLVVIGFLPPWNEILRAVDPEGTVSCYATTVAIYPVARGKPEDVGTEAGFHRWVWPREVAGKING